MPDDLKNIADGAYSLGINEFVVCASVHQPFALVKPVQLCLPDDLVSVSYTHLDVYKRQPGSGLHRLLSVALRRQWRHQDIPGTVHRQWYD